MSTLPHTAAPAAPVAHAVIHDAGPTPKRWTREEYCRLGEEGWFQDQRVELIDGEILVLSPQSAGHFWSTDEVARQLRAVFGGRHWVRCQGPLSGGEYSELEPDISVVRGSKERYSADHPSTAVLVVEVAKTSLAFDLRRKADLYASIGVPDYWVLDLERRALHVHREPVPDESHPFGHRYQQVATIETAGHVSPLEKPDATIAVADLLPPE